MKVSISSGLINDNGFGAPAIPLLSTGTPSITINGSLLALRDEPPLILIDEPAPGAPPLDVTLTPADLPKISCSGVEILPCWKDFEVIATTEPVRSLVCISP